MPKRNQGQTTTQKTESAPWAAAQPALTGILGAAANNYNTGVGQQYPDQSTYAGMGQTTQDALAQEKALASQGGMLSGQASNTVAGMLSGSGALSDLYKKAMAPTASATYLGDMAAGGGNNPYLQQLLSQGSDQIANQVKAAYSASGRYGSGDFTGALAKGVSDFQTPILYNAYDADQTRRLQAAGQIDSANQGALGLGLGAQNGMLSAAALAPQLDEAKYAGADRLLGAGQLEDADSQAQRDADVQRFMFEHGGAQTDALNNYANIAGAIGGMGGTTTGSTTTPPPTLLQSILGGASVAGGLLGGASGAGAQFPILSKGLKLAKLLL